MRRDHDHRRAGASALDGASTRRPRRLGYLTAGVGLLAPAPAGARGLSRTPWERQQVHGASGPPPTPRRQDRHSSHQPSS